MVWKVGIGPTPEAPKPILVLVLVQEYVAPVGVLVKGIVKNSFSHNAVSEMGVTTGLGLMVILKVSFTPGQIPSVGVTMICPVMGLFVVLAAVNPVISPIPEAGTPMFTLLFVHAIDAVVGVGVKAVMLIGCPAQIVSSSVGVTVAITGGLMITV